MDHPEAGFSNRTNFFVGLIVVAALYAAGLAVLGICLMYRMNS